MLPFDRLFRIVDMALEQSIIQDEVFAQIGESEYLPKNFAFERFVEKGKFDELIGKASLVIGHAGIGVIMQCLQTKTPLLVLPRLFELGEHVNDHQVSTAKKFEELGHIVAFSESNFSEKLRSVKMFVPNERRPNVAGISRRVAAFMYSL